LGFCIRQHAGTIVFLVRASVKKSTLLIVFLGLFVSFAYLFGWEELENAFEHSKIKEAPGFTFAKKTKVITAIPENLGTRRVVFVFEVDGKTYSTITSRTDIQGAIKYTTLPEYSKIIYDKRDPAIATLQHYYDFAEKDHRTLGRSMVVVSVLAVPLALLVTLFIWLIGLLVKRSRSA